MPTRIYIGIANAPIGTKSERMAPFNVLVDKITPLFIVKAPATNKGGMINMPASVGPGRWNERLMIGPTKMWLIAETTAIMGMVVMFLEFNLISSEDVKIKLLG
ncbi:hypothetical protein [[Eubacterium] cellulosolvens]